MQPLVENAIYHGIERKKGKGSIKVIGRKKEDHAGFSIIDDGIGMSRERLRQVEDSIICEKEDENFALVNISKRIKAIYGEQYHISIYRRENEGTEINFVIPLTGHKYSQKG